MRNQLNEELKKAMKAQDKRRVSTLRLINTAIKDRDIAARGTSKENVGDDEILLILTKMVKQREESAKTYEEAGRLDLSEQEREEITIIKDFLPKQLSQQEVEAAVADIVGELGAGGLKDMGRTMAALKEKYPGKMDFGLASKLVKNMLSK
ncbi:MAG: GatB/YqeY domain-containing protein [Fimbriimonadaceae bacterium]|nr:GatB/YqeY domain-containing protein [Alphaproteobacteria bacterium]